MGRIAITGVGVIGPDGAGFEALRARLDAGEPPSGEVDCSGGFHEGLAHRALASVPAEAHAGILKPLIARRMSPPSRFAVCAAHLAALDAGLLESPGAKVSDGHSTAICLGTAWGGTTYTLKLLRQLEKEGPQAISPFLFMETVPNAPAGQVAIHLGANGPNLTLTQRETSGAAAVVRGATLLRAGRARRVISGVSDEISPILHAVLARYGALELNGRPRPFGQDRGGTLATEGATVFVLEDEELARGRGAVPVALLRAWGRANDPTASATDWGTGWDSLARSIRSGLERHGIRPRDVGRLICGASGARRGDELEARMLDRLFEGEWPPALAPKQFTGEYGGGFLASILWALDLKAAPTGAMDCELDRELPVSLHEGGPLPPAGLTLVTSLASAGAASWMVLEKP